MVPPNMARVREYAKKWGITNRIARSEYPIKKLKVLVDGEWIHFGASAYQDFTTHGDLERQRRYCKRAGGIRDASGKLTGNDPTSANFYAMRLLWDCSPGK